MNHRVLVGAAAGLCATGGASAAAEVEPSMAPIPEARVSLVMDSGAVVNRTAARAAAFTEVVSVPGSPWLRLMFARADLAPGAAIRVTSLWDGYSQTLDAEGLRQWGNTSAYFNGDSVRVEIIADAGVGPSRVVMLEGVAGLHSVADSICGPTDDRVRSFDNRQGRALPIGCTAWMVYDCARCFLTAGHCTTTSLQVIQFNVPLSLPNGTIQNPPPEDQYTVDAVSRQGVNGGIGNDWGYFGVFPNTQHGQLPFERYGRQAYVLNNPAAPLAGDQIRITGYGVTSPANTSNQVQQTHVGPFSSFAGTTLQYATDTTGGNSGSPILLQRSGAAIGIHTHAGCTTSGGVNNGSSLTIAALRAALAAPRGVCLTRGLSGDVNGDRMVTFADLNVILGNFGLPAPGGAAGLAFGDINGDGAVTFADLNACLGVFGDRCDAWIP